MTAKNRCHSGNVLDLYEFLSRASPISVRPTEESTARWCEKMLPVDRCTVPFCRQDPSRRLPFQAIIAPILRMSVNSVHVENDSSIRRDRVGCSIDNKVGRIVFGAFADAKERVVQS